MNANKLLEFLVKNKFHICNAVLSAGASICIFYAQKGLTDRYLRESQGHKLYSSMITIFLSFVAVKSIYQVEAAQIISIQILIAIKFVKHESHRYIKKKRKKEIEILLKNMEREIRKNNIEWKNSGKTKLQIEDLQGGPLQKELARIFSEKLLKQQEKMSLARERIEEGVITGNSSKPSEGSSSVLTLLFLLNAIKSLAPRLRTQLKILIKLLKNLYTNPSDHEQPSMQ